LSQDMNTECKAAKKEYKISASMRKRPARLIFYDTIGKGGGVAAKAFDNVHEILEEAWNTVRTCNCEAGCVTCVHSLACREGNLVCSKIGALLVLQNILGLGIDPTSVPFQSGSLESDTIVEASTVRAVEGVQVEIATR